jgi:hypothetical protein
LVAERHKQKVEVPPMNPAILSALDEELRYHKEVPQDEELNLAVNGAFNQLRQHGVQEVVDHLPLRDKIQFLIAVLRSVPRDQFERLINYNINLFGALKSINYRLQIMRMQARKPADIPSEVSEKFREMFG